MLFPKGLNCKIALPDGIHVLSRGVNYTDFLHSRGIPKAEVFDRGGGGWFLNVIAQIYKANFDVSKLSMFRGSEFLLA
jgi:hypothetical protein